MPSEIAWSNLGQKGDKPPARSGHTLSWIGGVNYLLFGGIEDQKNGKIQPSNDIYTMKLAPNDCTWSKE
jgi:hypothetical protein